MKNKISVEDVISALDKVEEPELHDSLVKLHMVRNVKIEGETVSFDPILTTPACPLKNEIESSARFCPICGVKIERKESSSEQRN